MENIFEVQMLLDVKVPMKDGVNLSTDIYLPKTNEKLPTVLMRTPYSNNTDEMISKAKSLAKNGYACVMQDCRGRWDSEGVFYPFIDDGEDGFITQEWIGKQPWSNGKIGMSGSSYLGSVQWASAPYKSKYLTTMAPRVICCDFYNGLIYPGGALQLNVALSWGMRSNSRTGQNIDFHNCCLLYTSPSPRDGLLSRMPSSA